MARACAQCKDSDTAAAASESLSPQSAVFFVECGIVSHDPVTSDPTGPQRSLTGT